MYRTRLTTLISTMNEKDFNNITKLQSSEPILVINQYKGDNVLVSKNQSEHIEIINSTETGLSKSRNMGLKHITSEFGIITDNDVCFDPDYQKTIITEFLKNPEYDIIAFKVDRTSNKKKFKDYSRKINYLTSMKISSVEIAFRTQSIKDLGILFDEDFGAGSKYSMGEENIFLYDCLRKKIRILYVPLKIAQVDDSESTWFQGYNEKYFADLGAVYYRMTRHFYSVLIMQFALRKYRLYSSNLNIVEVISLMFKGASEYKYEK